MGHDGTSPDPAAAPGGEPEVVHVTARRPLVIRAARLVTAAGDRPQADAAVVVEGRRITYAGSAARAPRVAGAGVWDLPEATLLPGLIDAHVHLQGNETWDEYRQWLGTDPRLHVIRSAADSLCALRAGFTTVREMGVPGPMVAVQRAIEAGVVDGPRIVNSVAAISQTGGHADATILPLKWATNATEWFAINGAPKGVLVDGDDQCREAVRLVLRQGAAVIKLFLSHSRWEDDAETEHPLEFSDSELRILVEESHRRGLVVASHAESVESTRRAVAFGSDTVEHGMRLPDAGIIRMMAEKGCVLVPTLALSEITGRRGETWGFGLEESAAAARQVPERQEVVRAARRAGVEVAAGSSLGMLGRGENALELKLLAGAGMSALEAIVAGTRVAARACGLEGSIGTVEPGKLADLVAFAGDPTEDLDLLLRPPRCVFTTARAEAA